MSLGRQDVVDMLASYGDRAPSAVPEDIDSLGLAWLVHQVEQRYAVALDLSDDDLARMSTVSAAVEVLNRTVANA
jgi:acyl carrier protein